MSFEIFIIIVIFVFILFVCVIPDFLVDLIFFTFWAFLSGNSLRVTMFSTTLPNLIFISFSPCRPGRRVGAKLV